MRRATCMLVMLLLALAGVPRAQEEGKSPARPTPPRTRPAPISPAPRSPRIVSQVYVGEPAPDFELDGSQGRPVRLTRYKGYWVLLVFADSRAGLSPLKRIEADLRKLGVRPLGVSGDKAHALKAYAERERLPFVLLSDITGEISQLYGLYDYEQSRTRPGFVLMDRQGIVRMTLLGQTVPVEEVLTLVRYAVTGV